MNAYDHIDDYMAGRLAGSELAAFERLISEDQELRQMVENYDEIKSLSAGILESELLSEVELVQQGLSSVQDNKVSPNSPKGFFTSRNIIITAALAALVGMIIGYLGNSKKHLQSEPSKALFAQVYQEPIWPVSRTVDVDNIGKAVSYYLDDNQRDFERAKKILLDSVVDVKAGRYWLAEIYAKEEMMDSMTVYLPAYQDGDRFYNRTQVLRAYSLIYEDKLDEAKAVISRLPEGYQQRFILE